MIAPPRRGEVAARVLALAVALAGFTGLGIELAAQFSRGLALPAALWRLAGYFTILANLVVALVFAGLALRGRHFAHPRLLAGVTAAIVLVGVVYAVMLEGLAPHDGLLLVGDRLLHRATPILALAYWLVFARKGLLAWRDPLLWTGFPLLYLAYALARGSAEGRYAYPFIDLAERGGAAVAGTCAIITAAFLAAGALVVLLDRLLARRPRAQGL